MTSVRADTRFGECDDPNDVMHLFQRRSPDIDETCPECNHGAVQQEPFP